MAKTFTRAMIDFCDVVGWPAGNDIAEETIGPAGCRIIAIAAGSSESLALRDDGTLISWGANEITDSPDIEPCPTGQGYKKISIGRITNNPSIAIKSDDSIEQWGNYVDNWNSATPPAGNDFVDVSAGVTHGMALKADGSVNCWGNNGSGQVSPIPAGTFQAISAGDSFSVGLKTNGEIECWGDNTYGQTDHPAGTDYTAISAGGRFSLALKTDGSIVGWGDNSVYQIDCPVGKNFVAISAGEEFSVALRSNGSIICWGLGYTPPVTSPDDAYQPYAAIAAGIGYCFALTSAGWLWGAHDSVAWGDPNSLIYTELTAETGLVAIAAGYHHGLAIKEDGADRTIVAWGDDTDGQVSGKPAGTDFSKIAAGGSHSLALKTDMRTIISWGNDTYGQVTDTPSATLLKMAIAAGGNHSLAIHDLGSGYGGILAWGDDSCGQCSEKPTGSDFKAIAAGALHSVGLKNDGSVVVWGDDSHGQWDVPAGVFSAIACGRYHTIGLKTDGSLVGWGDNSDGQCDCPSGTDWVAIAAGGNTSAARKDEAAPTYGESISWGWMPSSSQYPAGKNFKTIAAGYEHALAIKSISTPRAVYFDTTEKKQMAVRCAKCSDDVTAYTDTIDITFSGITLGGGQSWPVYGGLPSDPNRKFTVPKCTALNGFDAADILWSWGNNWGASPTDPDFKGWGLYFKYGTYWDAEFGDWRVLDCGQLLLFVGGGSDVAFEARSNLKDPYSTGRARQGSSIIDLNSRMATRLPGDKRKFRNIITINVANTLLSTDTTYQSTGVFTFNAVNSYGGSALIEGGDLFVDQL
jgi:alpha-tubulin suppressor-like RCC1 family protein